MHRQDDELDKLEEDIRILKNKYDQFFAGISKLPPHHDRRNLEVFIYELNKKRIRDNARRFRLTTLQTRFNQYREMWSRKMREREEGPIDFRRRQAAMTVAPEAAPPPPPPEESRPRVTSPKADPYVKVTGAGNGDEVRKLYERIEREHLKMGKLPPMSAEQLGEMIRKQTESLRSKYGVDAVAFRVETVDGKVKLRAKPIQEK